MLTVKKWIFFILCGLQGLGVQVNKIAFSILYIARCHGYGSFCFLAILGRFWGLKNWFLAHIYNSTPPKCKIISKNLIYHYKVSSLAFLEKKNYCFKYHPCAIFASCITVSFLNLQNRHFYPIFGPQNVNLPGVSENFPFGCD